MEWNGMEWNGMEWNVGSEVHDRSEWKKVDDLSFTSSKHPCACTTKSDRNGPTGVPGGGGGGAMVMMMHDDVDNAGVARDRRPARKGDGFDSMARGRGAPASCARRGCACVPLPSQTKKNKRRLPNGNPAPLFHTDRLLSLLFSLLFSVRLKPNGGGTCRGSSNHAERALPPVPGGRRTQNTEHRDDGRASHISPAIGGRREGVSLRFRAHAIATTTTAQASMACRTIHEGGGRRGRAGELPARERRRGTGGSPRRRVAVLFASSSFFLTEPWMTRHHTTFTTLRHRFVPYRTVPCRTGPFRAVPDRTVSCRTGPFRAGPDRTGHTPHATTRRCTVAHATSYRATIAREAARRAAGPARGRGRAHVDAARE